MENITPEELLNGWKKGKTLYAALFDFTAPEIRKEYDDLTLKMGVSNRDIIKNSVPTVSATLAEFSKTLFLSGEIDSARDKLKWDLLDKIMSEKLIPLGYEAPIKSSDYPKIISLHIWPERIHDINWNNSSVSRNGIEFQNIRLIKKLPVKKQIQDKEINAAEIKDKKIGRPSLKEKIIRAYEHLQKEGNIDYSKTLKSHTDLIQKTVQKLFPEIKNTTGMKHEAIRRVIGLRFQDDRASKSTSKL